jgi:signal transduction histidine kinase
VLEHEREQARARQLAVWEVNRHLDDFFATAAHDIRSPVSSVTGHAQMAQRRLERVLAVCSETSAALSEALDALNATLVAADQSGARLARVSTQLFDVARARTGNLVLRLAQVDLVPLVREYVLAQQVTAPDRAITLTLPEESPHVPVLADPDRLGQVLTNYLTNALKYSAQDQPIAVRLEVSERLAVVAVQDHGPGLSWEEQSRVWELFHRAPGVKVQSGAEGSLGMGLHICKRLIELHPGGRVGVESVEGEGSTFWFRLPLAPAKG